MILSQVSELFGLMGASHGSVMSASVQLALELQRKERIQVRVPKKLLRKGQDDTMRIPLPLYAGRDG